MASVRLFPRIMTAAPHLAGCGQCFYEGPQRHTQTEDHAIGLGPAISCRAIEVSVGGLQQSGVRVLAELHSMRRLEYLVSELNRWLAQIPGPAANPENQKRTARN